MRSDEEMIHSVTERVQIGAQQKRKQQRLLRRTAAAALAVVLALSAVLGVALHKSKTIVLPVGVGYAFPLSEAQKNRDRIDAIAKSDDSYYARLIDMNSVVRDYAVEGAADAENDVVWNGGEVRLNVGTENAMNAAYESGFLVLLNGVPQSIRLCFADGSETEPAAVQPVLFEAKETKSFTVAFTPNVGEKGESLPLQLGEMHYPSYVAAYYGPAYGYGFTGGTGFSPHRTTFHRVGALDMKKHAPDAMPAAVVPVGVAAPEETYRAALVGAADADADLKVLSADFGADVNGLLFTSLSAEAASKSVNVLSADAGSVTVCITGPAARVRLSLFVDHTPVDLGGSLYADVETQGGMATNVTLPVDASALSGAHHVYALLQRTENGDSLVDKLPTEFLFVGETPAPEALPEKAPALTAPAGEVRSLGFTDETIRYTGLLENGKVAVITQRGENAWTSPLDLTIVDPVSGSRAEAELPPSATVWSVAGNRLIAVDNPALDDPHIAVFDENAERVSYVAYDPDFSQKTAIHDLKYDYQNSFRNIIVSDDGRNILYFRSGRGEADWKTYLIDVYTGKKTEIGSALNGENGEVTAQSGLMQYTDYGIVKGMIGDHFLTEHYSEADDAIEFSLVNVLGERIAGPVRVDSAAFMLSKPMSAYQLGESYAKNMGVELRAFRLALILLSSILSACVTAFAGPVSFVGIAVPHLVKTAFGTAKPIVIIPASFIGGAVFCLVCDLIARMLFAPVELSISTITAVFGAPVVIAAMLSRRNMKGSV